MDALIFLWPLLLIAGAVWLVVKVVRRANSEEDNTPAANFTADTVHPTVNTQSLPAPRSPTSATATGIATDIPAGAVLPQRDYFKMNESAINYYWEEAFYKNLGSFTGNNIAHADGNHGLIYYYNNKRIHLALKTTPDAYASILDKVSTKKGA